MKVKTAEQYLKRYRRIGAKRAPKTNASDLSCTDPGFLHGHPWDHAHQSRPNHGARVVPLPLVPLEAGRRPQQPIHPATERLSNSFRTVNYLAQNGSERLTARQRRRIGHKWGRAVAASEGRGAR